MATYGGFNYTNFKAINLRTTGALRFEMDGGKVGTLAVTASPDANRAWSLPDKSGKIGITGTFQVSIPTAVLTTGSVYSTAVTVAGVRVEDGLNVSLQGALATAGIVICGAVPGNGNITVYFSNTSGAICNVLDRTVAYTAVR